MGAAENLHSRIIGISRELDNIIAMALNGPRFGPEQFVTDSIGESFSTRPDLHEEAREERDRKAQIYRDSLFNDTTVRLKRMVRVCCGSGAAILWRKLGYTI